MTLLQALAIAAAAVLAALAAHAAWSARSGRPRRADASAAPARVEPGFAAAAAGAPDGAAPIEAELKRAGAARRSERLDALIDAVVTVAVEAPVAGQAALAHLPATRRIGSKPMAIEGLDAASGEWSPIAVDGRYGEFQAGVQLANRHGPLNEIEYSEFVQKVEAFAEGVGGTAEVPDMREVIARGRELDAFAGEHDATLTVHLRAHSVAWSVGYVQQIAARHGFVAGAVPGRMVLPSAEEGDPAVLGLAFDAQAALADDPQRAVVREIVLSLEVAQTSEGAEPFAAWQQAARALAEDMDAVPSGEDGRPITLHHYAVIAKEIETLYRALAARDLAAGSPAARRLFS